MEYIAGTSIVSYCDSRQLDITVRLRLFQAVCAAVQYAHEQRVVHRGLKPSNILVTEDGTVKLLDFGIAKLLEANSLALLETKHGLHVMTPEYASPEQVQGGPITTSTDVYGLGVVLYELITGRSPHRLKSRALHEIARVICEEEPIAPSKAVSQPDAELKGPSSVTVRTVREGRPDRLKRRLAGDLDHIVLKALRKEPARRYASGEEFREDIARHLQGLPIKARKDTIPYRAAKLFKRNWTTVMTAVATVAAIALVAVIVVKSAAYREDRRLRQILEEILVTDLSGRQGSNPDAIFSEWSRLRERFNLSQSGSSKTDLSILARRAAVRAEVTQVPSMGLKSDSPDIRMTVRLILDIGRATPTSVDFEVRDNSGPWRPLISVYCKCDLSSPASWSEVPLERFTSPRGPMTSHHLKFKAKLTIFDSASESVRAALNGSLDERARALAAVRPVSTETRSAGSFDFKTLRDIPEDYPPAVEDAHCETELASQFQLKRVRIVRTSSTSSKPNLISRIEMFGVFGGDSGCSDRGGSSPCGKGGALNLWSGFPLPSDATYASSIPVFREPTLSRGRWPTSIEFGRGSTLWPIFGRMGWLRCRIPWRTVPARGKSISSLRESWRAARACSTVIGAKRCVLLSNW
jgi:serine/threonine protein kinase